MGVSLSELVEAREIGLEDLRGKSIAIDAYNTLYQFLSIIRDRFTGEPLKDSKGRVTSHLSGIFYRTSKLLENGIAPVFVFDGKPPEFKRETSQARKEIREEAERKWKEAVRVGDMEAVRLYSQGASRLTDDMIEQAKHLLDYMGVSWVQAPSEGEAQAAFMVSKGIVWASGSQDWDSLLFGSPRLVRNLNITGRRKVPRKERYVVVKPEVVELQDMLSKLEINREQLVILGILVGTDYNPGGVKGTGPKTALKLVREFRTLDNVMKHVEWNFKISPEEIADFFLNPPVRDAEIEKNEMQPEKLREFLVEEHEFGEERIGSVIDRMKKGREESKQKGLDQFIS